jgi:hypothetical protein
LRKSAGASRLQKSHVIIVATPEDRIESVSQTNGRLARNLAEISLAKALWLLFIAALNKANKGRKSPKQSHGVKRADLIEDGA